MTTAECVPNRQATQRRLWPVSGRRVILRLLVGLLLLFVVFQWIVEPALVVIQFTSRPHPAIPAAASLGLQGVRDVTFPARDGVRLAGWYIPGRNGKAIIVLHGATDTRLGTLQHLRMLVQAGYAVLAYDARGHGESEGRALSYGWMGASDLGGAVDFLRQQPGVNPSCIAALGISTGAMEALRAAAEGVPVAAIIADGTGAGTLADMALFQRGVTTPIFYSSMWVAIRGMELVSGYREPAPLVDIVGQIRVPVLFISANPAIDQCLTCPPHELEQSQLYRERIGANADLWYVADVSHAQALSEHPQEYSTRVTTFLETAIASPRK